MSCVYFSTCILLALQVVSYFTTTVIVLANLVLQAILFVHVFSVLVNPHPTLSLSGSSNTKIISGTDSGNRTVSKAPTGKMTPSAIILLILGGLIYLWIVFALVFALLMEKDGRPYLVRVKDALKFQLH